MHFQSLSSTKPCSNWRCGLKQGCACWPKTDYLSFYPPHWWFSSSCLHLRAEKSSSSNSLSSGLPLFACSTLVFVLVSLKQPLVLADLQRLGHLSLEGLSTTPSHWLLFPRVHQTPCKRWTRHPIQHWIPPFLGGQWNWLKDFRCFNPLTSKGLFQGKSHWLDPPDRSLIRRYSVESLIVGSRGAGPSYQKAVLPILWGGRR